MSQTAQNFVRYADLGAHVWCVRKLRGPRFAKSKDGHVKWSVYTLWRCMCGIEWQLH